MAEQEIALLVNVFYLIYDLIRAGIEYLLSMTLYKANPEYAVYYADAISILIPVTAIWLILEFTHGVKKFIKYIVIIGWLLVLVSIFISLV